MLASQTVDWGQSLMSQRAFIQGSEPTVDRFGLNPSLAILRETREALQPNGVRIYSIEDSAAGLAFEEQTPFALGHDALDEVFGRIDRLEADRAQTREAAMTAAKAAGSAVQELLDLPGPIRDLALEAATGSGWSFAGPGVKSMNLHVEGGYPIRLLRIEPGCGAPCHDHTGTEYTLVLSGAFKDGTGRFGRGDLSVKSQGQQHRPIAEQGAVCFALAVEEGSVAFTGALGLVQKLFSRH
jgi:putative transcriptional regulator